MLPVAPSGLGSGTEYSWYVEVEDEDRVNESTVPDRPSTPPPDPSYAPAVGMVTPPREYPQKRKIEITPEKNKQAREMLGSMNPDDAVATLTRDEREILLEGIESIKEATDTPIKKKRSETAKRTYVAFLSFAVSGQEPDALSPSFHKRMSPTLLHSPWLGRMMNCVEKIHRGCDHPVPEFPALPDILVDLEHITSPQQGKKKKMGHHFCRPESPEYQQLVQKVVHRKTGVLFAKYDDGNDALKSSSYFPAWILNEEQLVIVLLSGAEVAKQNNRTLCLVNVEGKRFAFEAYFRERADRRIINSAFPIFSFTDLCCPDFADVLDIHFVDINVTPSIDFDHDNLIRVAREILQKTIALSIDLRGMPTEPSWQDEWMLRRPCIIDDSKCPIRYLLPATERIPERLVFDFAERFVERTGVSKGVLVAIPVTVLKDLPGCSAIVRAMNLSQ